MRPSCLTDCANVSNQYHYTIMLKNLLHDVALNNRHKRCIQAYCKQVLSLNYKSCLHVVGEMFQHDCRSSVDSFALFTAVHIWWSLTSAASILVSFVV